MNIEDIPNNTTEYNSGLLSLNNFLIEQAEINEYAHLVKSIISQLDRFLKPVATIYSEYDADNKLLRIIEINANQDVLNLLLKFGGRKILSTVTFVNDDMYKKMAVGRLEIVSSLHEASGGAIA